jgi:methyl-accepting chemotaxis protein
VTRDRLLATATFRFGLAYAGLFTLSVALVAALAYAGMSRALELQVRGAVRAALEELQQRSDAGGEGSLRQAVADLVARRRSSPFVYAYLDPRHRLLAGDDVTPADAGPGWLRFEAPALARDEREPRSFLGRAVRLGDGGLLVVARDVDEVDDFRETLLAGAAWTVAATLLLAVGVGALMGRFVLGRIDAVTATAARIVAGDLGHRVPLSGSGDEFDRLAAQINAMLDRIGGLMAGLRQVTDDVAHDLRTPLGRLRNRLEAMLRHDDVAEGLREETAQALAEADGMLDLAITHIFDRPQQHL